MSSYKVPGFLAELLHGVVLLVVEPDDLDTGAVFESGSSILDGDYDAERSARIAGAKVVESATVSQSSIDVDVLEDPEVSARLLGALQALVEESAEAAA